MFKKNLLGVTPVLFLAVILVFTGCPTSSGGNTSQEYEEEPQYPSSPPAPRPKEIAADKATASNINSQLSSSSTSKVTLTAEAETTVTIDAVLEVPAGKQLEIGTNVTLAVPDSQTAEIKGTVAVAKGGTLDFSGLADETDQVALTGTITVESGGVFKMKNSATPNQSSVAYDGGKLVLKQGSTAYLDSNLYIGSAADNAPFQWASSGTGTTIEFSSTDDINIITLKGGEITVKGGTTPVMAAVIDGNATLTVEPETAFVVVISLEVKGTLKANKTILGATAASTITFDSGDAVLLSGDYVGTTDGNFYASGSTDKEAAAAGTYTWAANAGGDSVAGWKAGS